METAVTKMASPLDIARSKGNFSSFLFLEFFASHDTSHSLLLEILDRLASGSHPLMFVSVPLITDLCCCLWTSLSCPCCEFCGFLRACLWLLLEAVGYSKEQGLFTYVSNSLAACSSCMQYSEHPFPCSLGFSSPAPQMLMLHRAPRLPLLFNNVHVAESRRSHLMVLALTLELQIISSSSCSLKTRFCDPAALFSPGCPISSSNSLCSKQNSSPKVHRPQLLLALLKILSKMWQQPKCPLIDK